MNSIRILTRIQTYGSDLDNLLCFLIHDSNKAKNWKLFHMCPVLQMACGLLRIIDYMVGLCGSSFC